MNKDVAHILVVDDDNRIRELVKEYLEEEKFLVNTAKDTNEARKKMEIIKDAQLRTGGLLFAIIGFIIIWYIKS